MALFAANHFMSPGLRQAWIKAANKTYYGTGLPTTGGRQTEMGFRGDFAKQHFSESACRAMGHFRPFRPDPAMSALTPIATGNADLVDRAASQLMFS